MFRAFGLLMLMSLALAIWTFRSVQKLQRLHELAQLTSTVRLSTLEIRKNEKEFLTSEVTNEDFYTTQSSPHATQIATHVEGIRRSLDQLEHSPFLDPTASANAIGSLRSHSAAYVAKFDQLFAQLLARGFKDHGKVGQLRDAIHQIEQMPYPYDTVGMLMLRRHEKDFMLRRDLRYTEKFDEAFGAFRTRTARHLHAREFPQDSIDHVLSLAHAYAAYFHEVVQAEQAIGLTHDSGLLADLTQEAEAMEVAAHEMGDQLQNRINQAIRFDLAMLLLLFGAQIVLGIVLAFVFSRKLTSRIRVVQDRIVALAKGKLSASAPVSGEDELAAVGHSLNQLNAGLQRYAHFAHSIGQGEFDRDFEKLSEEDQIGEALLRMRTDLKNIQLEEQRRSFVLDGVSFFSSLIRQQQDDVYTHVLSQLIKRVRAVMGGIFVRQTDEDGRPVLRLESCYAWDRKKFLRKEIYPGEGITGQVYLEQQKVVLTELPADYVQVKSGTGGARPQCLLVMPLMTDGVAYGTMELASFHPFEPQEIELAEKVGEALAVAVSHLHMQQNSATLAH
ncbi:HAMP domain-containing protein [Catalinimonas alkaloidigena]|uniref:HAMP domain-containing protein n=2 Tax=Catalinimonas alkaloidigena TaxID=1075417 RepID=A0A1G9DJK5_9BACT|nr:HAMP domain-containing protein [Catalinimonas alkaloidigena]